MRWRRRSPLEDTAPRPAAAPERPPEQRLWARFKVLVLNLVGAATLSAMVVHNGYPFFYFDTHGYYTTGQKAVGAVLDVACRVGPVCRSSAPARIARGDGRAPPDATADAGPRAGTISTGRSVYYGALLYLSDRAAGVWLVVAAQALTVAWILHLVCRRLLPGSASVGFLCLIGVLTAFSSLPFFVGYLMPDVFAGLCILAVALLIACPERLTRSDRAALWLLLVGGFLFHRSHLLTGAILVGLMACLLLIFDRVRLRRAATPLFLTGAAVAVGIAGFVLFGVAASRLTGQLATLPPFLLARVIADGPGTGYLRQACADRHYAVCRFVDRMPMPVTDFLWSADPNKGVWYVVTPEERVRIANEQFEVVLRSFLYAPLQQFISTARDFAQQLIHFSVLQFAPSDELKLFMKQSFAGEHAERFAQSRIASGDSHLGAWSVVHYLAVGGAVLLLAMRYRELDAEIRTILVIVLCGIMLNGLITGAISTPDHRFQARVIWLMPALAVIVEFGRRVAWPRRAGPAPARLCNAP